LYIRTGFHHYCTLRSELLLTFRDLNILSIFVGDPCSKFIPLVRNAIEANGTVNLQKVKELNAAIKEIPTGDNLRGEYAMILADPNITDTFVKTIFHCLKDVVDQMEEVPDFRKHVNVNNLTCCVDLGLKAYTVIKEATFKKHSPGKDIFVTFYGLLIHRLVDDKLKEFNEISPEIVRFFHSEPIARKLILYYALQQINAEEIQATKQLLQLIGCLEHRLNAEETFLHSLVTLPSLQNSTDLQNIVIGEFLMPRCTYTSVHIALLEFLTNANAKLSASELLGYLESICQFTPAEEQEGAFVLPYATKFMERVTSRVRPENAPFFFKYLEKLKNPTSDMEVDSNASITSEPEPEPEPESEASIQQEPESSAQEPETIQEPESMVNSDTAGGEESEAADALVQMPIDAVENNQARSPNTNSEATETDEPTPMDE